MPEPLGAPISKLQAAREDSRAQLEQDVAGARDAFVALLNAYQDAERAWLQRPGDEQLAAAAQDAWDALRTGRATLRQALQTAVAKRDSAQRAAWTQTIQAPLP